MKTFHSIPLFLFTLMTLVSAPFALAAPQKFEGVISDSMCGNKHMMPGKSDAQCIQECVKAGSKYVLMVGGKMYALTAKPTPIAPLAGKHVRVTGELKGTTILVTSIQEAAK